MSTRVVQVYRSPLKDEMYLIVDRAVGLERVPEALLARFGRPEASFVFALSPERTLARANPLAVAEALDEHGFYLQMPPPEDERRSEDASK